MSLNPVYLWNPQNFPDPQAMLSDGFDSAHRIVSEWAGQLLPHSTAELGWMPNKSAAERAVTSSTKNWSSFF